jgi:predicted metal-dependent peptidase
VSADVETKLRAARTRLILDRPFIGALVMHLRLAAADPRQVATLATDARSLYYNARYVAGLTFGETQFVLAHEALHCALGHFARRAHRVRRRWDVACDHAANWLLREEGLTPPAGALLDSRFRGLSAEEIYPLIPEDTAEMPLDLHAFDIDETALAVLSAGNADGLVADGGKVAGGDLAAAAPPGELAEEAAAMSRMAGTAATAGLSSTGAGEGMLAGDTDLAEAWRMRIASAAQQAMRAGRLSADWQRAIDHLIEPSLPWRALLARFLMRAARDDYSFRRPSRREGDAIPPRLETGALEVVAALDVSGSIAERELAEFVAELNALKGHVHARITLHACDAELAAEGPWVFEPWQAMRVPGQLTGGGGTRFTPVFDWVERAGLAPDLLVYFTDAQGEFPALPPPYPVLWLVKGRDPVPWGERIQLN